MRSLSQFLKCLLVLCATAIPFSLPSAPVEPPPQPEKMSEIQRAGAIAVYEDLVKKTQPLKVGDTEASLLQRLGEPDGIMAFGSRKRLDYDKGHIIVSNGKVQKIDGIPAERLASPNQEAYADYQNALGKVYYMDRWMTPEEGQQAYNKALESRERELERIAIGREQTLRRKEQIARSQSGWKDIRQNGARITEQELIVPGRYTVVDFYADWCGPCKRIEPYLKDLAKDKRIAVRKVDIVNWESPVARQWNLRSIPNMRVYDPNGRMLGEPTSNLNQIIAYINDSLARR
ncbi:MAG: thioredoxin family protein [Puniceicoccaceae bacterium]